ncbi:fibronectin type III domain-containing protein [Neobacillus niacini]|uniref:fibronectin type III domain-containing protein n=1 Tax=Neobacillus niacini TaxID=86668 RepID=UPI001C8F0BC1|nr:pre-peptidase C-terminal domain-containing protein [Neobacillus niacini]MBY0145064.1 pre-peptidase C-terminal domain-containing protein [Neobacillus niacini]
MKKVLSASFFVFILSLFFSGLAFAEGTSISNGTPITAKLAKGAIQTYEFTTSKDGQVYITLDKTSSGFLTQLFDSNGNYITNDYTYTGGDMGVLEANLQQGTYRIEVTPYNWSGISSATYRIKATFPAAYSRNATTLEPNDTAETSITMTNGKFYSTTAENMIDRDVYKFTTNKDGEVYITLDQITAGFKIELYDSNGNYQTNDYTYSGGDSAVLKMNLQQGTYYLYISPYNWSGKTSASYRVKATYPGSFTRSATTFETNDTAQTSMQMISNKSYSSSSDSGIDRDVYQFTTNSDGNAAITLDKVTAGYVIYLVDIYGNRITNDYLYSAGDTAVLKASLQKGTYYLYIDPYNWSGTTSATYQLKASFIDKTPSVDPMYDSGKVITGKAVSNTKVYAYAGTVKLGEATVKNGAYSITVSPQKAGTVIGVYTVDTAGNTSTTAKTTVVNSTVQAVSVDYTKIKVSWYSVPGANGYEVYRSTASTGTYSKIATVTSGSTLTYTNSSVSTGTNYYYKVRAYRTINGVKVYSPYTKVAIGKAIPLTPTSVKAASTSYNSLKTSWTAVSGATGYEVYQATSSTGTYSRIATTTSTSFTKTGLTTNQTYYIKVRAYRTVGSTKVYSNYSTVVSAKPIPSVPASFTAARASSTSVKVTWGSVTGATGYEVYRAATSTGTYSLLKSTTSSTYTNTGLTTGKTYYYKVRAYRTVGTTKVYSGWTKVIGARP